MQQRYLLFLYFTLFLCTFSFILDLNFKNSYAADEDRLIKVRKEITKLDKSLSLEKLKLTDIKQRIAIIDQRIDKSNLIIINNQNKINDRKLILIGLRDKKEKLKKSLVIQRQHINKYIKTIFLMGREPYLKLLFSQQDPKLFGRMQHYFQYIMRANLKRLDQAEKTAERLKETKDKLISEKKNLEQLIDQQEINLSKLSKDKILKSQLVSVISASINDKSNKLNRLYKNEQRLLKLIEKIDQESLKLVQNKAKSFSMMKNKLICPFINQKIRRSLISLATGDIQKNQAVLIPVKEKSAVKAAYYGQVVFANTLKGYGELIIIDHGQNYMSLYGYNHKLLVTKGQWVSAGDKLALSGQGLEGQGIYFELRHNNQIISWKSWCKKTNLAQK
ncbi:murein hydrolase activator EnvC family protein [Piscirickettsia litoralis]|uniref:murein hydrolase activator EnvC family protein n=1 Tax=Piscirickettsia litoralis TaxID=1891921 RepID=UPI0009812E13|nr:peptidoglycan DD-metalloendopeptidase family protein [Piscirickettsia litoralis]